jgi:hypothetical protein
VALGFAIRKITGKNADEEEVATEAQARPTLPV